ncbi:MAG TPA: ferritin-like domain-containing protein [Solirubrobacteraceae bacterium]|jgi:ferritin-like metal-binding protein YciE|nr:ferritin-like domain-containing protein [Solirubrobacteraceae bacterium]
MFEHLDTPEEIFSFKLGSALKMEQDILKMLGDLHEQTQRQELHDLFAQHAEETKQHIANIERSFELLGEEPDDSPSPVTKGLIAEGKSSIKKTNDAIVDAVIMAGAIETEHYEIAVYEILVTNAEARGAPEVAALLRANLESEQAALDKVKAAAERIANTGYALAA